MKIWNTVQKILNMAPKNTKYGAKNKKKNQNTFQGPPGSAKDSLL